MLIHRIVVAIWRNYFHPPADDPKFTTWERGRRAASKFIAKPACEGDGHPVRQVGW